jgi:hypothetical protein
LRKAPNGSAPWPAVRPTIIAFLSLGFCLSATQASAQGQTIVLCTYSRCALGIAPTWNGLAVVKGAAQVRVANLNFFWPSDIRNTFSGGERADSAMRYAKRAVHLRRVAAVLTDVGSILGGYALVHAATNKRLNPSDRAIGLAGAAMFAVGVPFQFAADGSLSRAVWWYNLSFTEPPGVRFGN